MFIHFAKEGWLLYDTMRLYDLKSSKLSRLQQKHRLFDDFATRFCNVEIVHCFNSTIWGYRMITLVKTKTFCNRKKVSFRLHVYKELHSSQSNWNMHYHPNYSAMKEKK